MPRLSLVRVPDSATRPHLRRLATVLAMSSTKPHTETIEMSSAARFCLNTTFTDLSSEDEGTTSTKEAEEEVLHTASPSISQSCPTLRSPIRHSQLQGHRKSSNLKSTLTCSIHN